jgi:hypothetical protein
MTGWPGDSLSAMSGYGPCRARAKVPGSGTAGCDGTWHGRVWSGTAYASASCAMVTGNRRLDGRNWAGRA